MTASTPAEIAAITDALERSRQRVVDLAGPYIGTDEEDVAAAIYEVERSLLAAHRALQRVARRLESGA